MKHNRTLESYRPQVMPPQHSCRFSVVQLDVSQDLSIPTTFQPLQVTSKNQNAPPILGLQFHLVF